MKKPIIIPRAGNMSTITPAKKKPVGPPRMNTMGLTLPPRAAPTEESKNPGLGVSQSEANLGI